jgi:hypothetical protein
MHLSLKGSMDRQPLTDRLGDRLLAEYGGAAAAYSLRALNGNGDSVVRVRRASDNDEKDFTAEQIELGEMVNWVNSQIVPPLDIGVLTPEGRIPVPEGGTSIGIPAAAYSLRNLSTTYTGNVVDVRRSSGGTESFTAAEVADGTLEAWVTETLNLAVVDFDGVDDNLDLDSNQSFSGAFTWSFKLLLSSTATAQVIFADSSVNNLYVRTNVTASVFEFRIGGSAASVFFDSNLESGTLYDIQISRNVSDVITVVVDGVTQSDDAKTLTGTFIVNRFGMRNAAFNPLGGLLYNVNLGNGLEWDGTIADGNTIGTVNGSPTTTTIQVQGDTGFVSQWYDQSGNDNHATQGTAASQPKIVDGGTLVTKLGQPSMDFTTGSTMLLSDSFSITETESAVFAIWQPAKDSATTVQARNRTLFGNASSQIYIGTPNADSQMSFKRFDAVKTFTLGLASLNTPNLHAFVGTTAGADYYFNGSSIYSDTATGTNSIRNHLRIGAKQNLATHDTEGYISELIIYDSDQSANRTAIEANIGETYGITGIPAYDNTVDGFVETWYDQSGNGNDATQSVAASQPKIVNAGVFLGEVDFLDGVNTFLETTNSALCNVDELSVFSVLKPFIAQSQTVAFSCGSVVLNSSAYGGWRLNFNGYLNKAEFQTQAVGNSSGSTVSNDVGGSYTLLSYVADFPDASTFANGQAGLTSTNNISPNNPDSLRRRFRIGCQYTFTRAGFYPEPIKEIILYTSDQSANRVAIETNINDHYNIY